jgi:hypothetical protein
VTKGSELLCHQYKLSNDDPPCMLPVNSSSNGSIIKHPPIPPSPQSGKHIMHQGKLFPTLKFFVVWIFEKEGKPTTTRPHREVGEDLRECFWGNIILARGLSATSLVVLRACLIISCRSFQKVEKKCKL